MSCYLAIPLQNRRLGGVRAARAFPPVTGKSFRSCVRAVSIACGNEPQNRSGGFPFPFWPQEAFPFPFLTWPFPFPLRPKVKSSEDKVKSKVKSKWIQNEINVKSK
jgi:hypothetical protein